jgi:hypothetical protein
VAKMNMQPIQIFCLAFLLLSKCGLTQPPH